METPLFGFLKIIIINQKKTKTESEDYIYLLFSTKKNEFYKKGKYTIFTAPNSGIDFL